jgi:hypothetical protein
LHAFFASTPSVVVLQPSHSGTYSHVLQVLGELFHRMSRVREFPSRLMTADIIPLPECLQPGVMRLQEPTSAFPRAGFYKGGVYYALQGIAGNLVNVRSAALPLWLCPSLDLDDA